MTKNKLYRHIHDHDTAQFKSVAGNQFEKEERLVIDDDGLWSLESVGVVDQQALIDSYRESTDLKSMIERYKDSGDISNINRVSGGSFLDLTGAPESLAEYYRIVDEANAEFMNQPLSVREQFGHNPVAYFNALAANQRAAAAAAATAPAVEPKGDVAE